MQFFKSTWRGFHMQFVAWKADGMPVVSAGAFHGGNSWEIVSLKTILVPWRSICCLELVTKLLWMTPPQKNCDLYLFQKFFWNCVTCLFVWEFFFLRAVQNVQNGSLLERPQNGQMLIATKSLILACPFMHWEYMQCTGVPFQKALWLIYRTAQILDSDSHDQ